MEEQGLFFYITLIGFVWKKKVIYTRMPWGGVKHGLIFIFSWTNPLKCFYPSMFLFLLSVCLSHSFYSAAVATNAVHTSSDITNTYLGKTGAGVELLVTVWMLLVLLVVELFFTVKSPGPVAPFPYGTRSPYCSALCEEIQN